MGGLKIINTYDSKLSGPDEGKVSSTYDFQVESDLLLIVYWEKYNPQTRLELIHKSSYQEATTANLTV